jgi:hypothetical protein
MQKALLAAGSKNSDNGGKAMAVKELAEKVILQSIEDLWDKEQRDLCSAFFCGQGFSFWAEAAGMTMSDKRKILSLILAAIPRGKGVTREIHASRGGRIVLT